MADYPDHIFENLRPGEAPRRRKKNASDSAPLRQREKRHMRRPFPVMTLEKALKRALNLPSIRRWMNVAEISDAWEGIVGEVVANHVRPVSLEKGVLTLKTDSSVWRQQISLSKDWLYQRIQEKFDSNSIRSLRIK